MDINDKKINTIKKKRLTAETRQYISMPPILQTNYHLLAAKQEPYQTIGEFFWKKSGEWASRQKKDKNRNSNGSRQKNKKGDCKVESNDSP